MNLLYRISLNTCVLLMVFNEILIPQDSFTKTNVTRKRSIVGNWHLSQIIIVDFLEKGFSKETFFFTLKQKNF